MAPQDQVQLPGANVLAVLMAAPTDIISLATRHITETMGVFNAGVQRLGIELTKPPTLPAGFPFPGFPGLPGMPGAGAPAPTGAGVYVPPPPTITRRATVER